MKIRPHLALWLAPTVLILSASACGDPDPKPTDDTTIVGDTGDDTTPPSDADVASDVGDAVDPKPGLGIDYTTTAPGAAPSYDPNGTDWLAVGWPSDKLRTDNHVDLSNFPGQDVSLFEAMVTHGNETLDGFGLNSAIYLGFQGAIDPGSVPSADASVAPAAYLQLVNVTPGSPAYNSRVPIVVRIQTHGEDLTFPIHTLALRPVYGFPLTEGDVWCAIATRALKDMDGNYLSTSDAFATALNTASYLAPLKAWIAESPLRADDIAVATCFTTQHATADVNRIARFFDDGVPPEVDFVFEPFVFNEFFGTYTAPNFQAGDKPYATEGGGILFDANGDPIVQDEEDIRYLLLIPRDREAPADGWPVIIYSHGTTGDYESCRGTASIIMPRGFAVLCSDQPLHGSRGPGGVEMNENDLTLYSFNFLNPPAGRSGFRQAAADTLLQSRMIEAGRFDIPAVATRAGQEIKLDPNNIMFFGHSHGGLSGTLALGVDGHIKAGVISGMAGVLVETILRRVDPFDIGQLAALLVGIPRDQLDSFHPVLNLLQTLVEVTDPINYTRLWTAPPAGGLPRHMFITQGTLDDASPSVGNDAAAAAGLIPIAAPVSKESEAHRLRGMAPITPPFSGNITLPAGTRLTTVVRQWQGGSHFVATSSIARNIWAHFLETAIGDEPPEIPAFEGTDAKSSPTDGADDCGGVNQINLAGGFPVEVRGNTAIASAVYSIEGCGTAAAGAGSLGRDLVYGFTAPAGGTYRFRLSVPSAIDNDTPRAAPNLFYLTSACGVANLESCRGTAGRTNLDLALTANEALFIQVDGLTAFDRGPFTITIEQLCLPGTCEGRQCGFDGCTSCGSCVDADYCTADGKCEARVQGDSCVDPIPVDSVPFFDTSSTLFINNDQWTLVNRCENFPFAFGAGSSDLIYAFTPPAAGVYTVRVDAVHDVVVYASTDCEDAGDQCHFAARGVYDPTILRLDLPADDTMYIVVDGVSNTGNSAGDFTISIEACVPQCGVYPCGDDGCGGSCGTCPDSGTCVVSEPFCYLPGQCAEERECVVKPGDMCGNAFPIVTLPFEDSQNTRTFYNQYGYGEGWCPGSNKTTGFGANDVAYAFTAPEDGLYKFSLDTGTPPLVFDASLYLVGACDDIEGSCIAADDRARNEIIWRNFTAAESAFVIVDGWTNYSNFTGNYKLKVDRCVATVTAGECGSDGCNGNFGNCNERQTCNQNRCVDRPGLGCQALRGVGALPWREKISTAPFLPAREDGCDGEPATIASPDISYVFKAPTTGTYHFTADAAFPVRLYGASTCAGTCQEAGRELIVDLQADALFYFVVDGVDGDGGAARSGEVTVGVKAYCAPQCEGRMCGDDSCGGICGTCAVPADVCDPTFQCVDPKAMAGNTCESARVVAAFPFTGTGDTSVATNAYIHDENACTGWVAKGMGSNDEVWRINATEAGRYGVEVVPDGWDAAVFAYSDCDARASSCLGASDSQGSELIWLDLAAGASTYIVIDGTENILNDSGSYTLRVVRVDDSGAP